MGSALNHRSGQRRHRWAYECAAGGRTGRNAVESGFGRRPRHAAQRDVGELRLLYTRRRWYIILCVCEGEDSSGHSGPGRRRSGKYFKKRRGVQGQMPQIRAQLYSHFQSCAPRLHDQDTVSRGYLEAALLHSRSPRSGPPPRRHPIWDSDARVPT